MDSATIAFAGLLRAVPLQKQNFMGSWTLSLLRETWPYLTLGAFMRYRNFLIAPPHSPTDELLELQLTSDFGGRPLYLRKWGTDLVTFNEVFVKQVYRPVVENVKQCRTLLDVGSNVGLATIYFTRHFHCKAMCVEPNPETFAVLSKNLLGTADLLHAAVWSQPCMLTPEFKEARFSTSCMRPNGSGKVPGVPMAELIAKSGFETVDMVKMDVEGAEVEAFKGDRSWLRKVRALAIEFHGDSRRDMGFDAVMEEYGFRVTDYPHTSLAVLKDDGVRRRIA
jgi:FkbM family methyltransferase